MLHPQYTSKATKEAGPGSEGGLPINAPTASIDTMTFVMQKDHLAYYRLGAYLT